MGTSLNVNALNQIKAGAVIYKQGDLVDTVGIVLEGRVIVYNQGVKTIIAAGCFVGISDVYQTTYMSNYIAYDKVSLFVFESKDKKDVKKIMDLNKDYNGLMVCNLNKYIMELSIITATLKNKVDEIFGFIDMVYNESIDICETYGYNFNIQIDHIKKYVCKHIVDRDEQKYYGESSKLPDEVHKTYFAYSTNLAYMHVSKQSELVNKLIEESITLASYGKALFELIINDENNCIFKELSKIAQDLKSDGKKNDIVINLIDRVIVEINKIEKFYLEKSSYKLQFDRKEMEATYTALSNGIEGSLENSESEINSANNLAEVAMSELKDSLNQILAYSEIEEEKKEEIRHIILEFKMLKDKTSISEDTRILRRKITEVFYELYLKVYLKAKKDKNSSRVLALFLNYGFIEETLLTRNQCVELYHLKDDNGKQDHNDKQDSNGKQEDNGKQDDNVQDKCRIYTVKQWLDEIYEGRKEPSKNEFDLEYNENLREIKKYKQISAEEEKDYFTNPIKKVEYEIKNMFKYNNRLVNGQVSIFVPILHKDIINKTMSKMLNTRNKINEEINHLRSIDYSAFYREILYYNESKGIPKAYIVKQALPDIILMPTVGTNAIMWQEIEGRKRDTSGRFILPIFGETDLFDMLIKATGRFRFELCRTIEGISWNDVRVKSLTSEYSDYIQSYTRNRDLSEEQKLKIKHQVQKGRNNLREIFVLDYITWIQNESQGYLRLNKAVRAIMSSYCPFVKEIRERNAKQPLFDEAMTRYVRDRLKKFKECGMSIKKLEKDKIDIPVEIEDTLKFYSEL